MKIIDNEVIEIKKNHSSQEKLPHGLSSMILGIVSISICLFYGAGIVVSLIARSQIKKDLLIYEADPLKYEKSFKMTKVAKITSTCGLYVSIGMLLLIILVGVIDNL